MKTLNLTLLLIIISFTGCKTIRMRAYGGKLPRIENENTLINYALKIGLDTSNIVTFRSADDFSSVLMSQAFPDGILFNSSGDFIEYKQSDTSCNVGLFTFIKDLQKNEAYKISDKLKLQNELNLLGTLKRQPLQNFDLTDYDFVFFIYWTKWIGKLNIDKVKEWQQLAAYNKNVKIKTILVNMDIQEYWEKEKRDELLKFIRRSI